MKNKKIIILGLVVILSLAVSLSVAYAGPDDRPIHNNKDLKAHFDKMDIVDTDVEHKIKKDEAIKIANEFTGYIDKEVHAQKVIMTNEDILIGGIPENVINDNPQIKEKGFLYKVPVWIISYEGVKINRTKGIVLNERNLVIDAHSGEIIYGFNYR